MNNKPYFAEKKPASSSLSSNSATFARTTRILLPPTETLFDKLSSRRNDMDSMPVTNKAAGEPLSTKSHVLETGAALTQVCP